MYWEKCDITYFNSGAKGFVKISRPEVQSGIQYWVYISKNAFEDTQKNIPLDITLKGYNL